jgi:hypothetical protein
MDKRMLQDGISPNYNSNENQTHLQSEKEKSADPSGGHVGNFGCWAFKPQSENNHWSDPEKAVNIRTYPLMDRHNSNVQTEGPSKHNDVVEHLMLWSSMNKISLGFARSIPLAKNQQHNVQLHITQIPTD